MQYKIFELPPEWFQPTNAMAPMVGMVEAETLEEAIKKAKENYPNRSLRITDGTAAVEVKV